MTQSDLRPLQAEGLSDQDLLDITLLAATFNFIKRIALGLGVSYSAEELSGYRDDWLSNKVILMGHCRSVLRLDGAGRPPWECGKFLLKPRFALVSL